MKNSHHNTTGLKGEELEIREKKCKSQEEDVLEVFQVMNKSKILTPELVLKHLTTLQPSRYSRTPLTSIRRAFSNLKDKGLILQSNIKVRGNFGMDVNGWMLNSNNIR